MNDLREKISTGKLDQAIQLMQDKVANSSVYQKHLLAIRAKYQSYLEAQDLGTINTENFQVAKNKLTYHLLLLLDNYEKGILEPPVLDLEEGQIVQNTFGNNNIITAKGDININHGKG